jgi:hypothetical protein
MAVGAAVPLLAAPGARSSLRNPVGMAADARPDGTGRANHDCFSPFNFLAYRLRSPC